MTFSSPSAGLAAAMLSATAFATSGPFIKPMLQAGWSPGAAVTARVFTAAVVLLPFVILSLRGRWGTLWLARWQVLCMGVVGVGATQLLYFAAIKRIPVSSALLIEFLAPVLLICFAWASTRRAPRPTVLTGSVLAVGGLVLVIGPGALQVVDPVGLILAFGAALGCAVYFVVASQTSGGLPPVALAGTALFVGGLFLALGGVTGLLPFTATVDDLPLLGTSAPWWVPLLIVAVIGTALAYAAGITASGLLGSRLASFVGLFEVICASVFAWLLLGEELTLAQLLGGALILGGVAAVRADRTAEPTVGPQIICSTQEREAV